MKQTTITVRLPQATRRRLDAFRKREQRHQSEIIRDALKQYFVKEEFRCLRAKLVPHAQARGLFRDEDVFDRVS